MIDTVVSAPEADAPATEIAEYSATAYGLAELRSRLAGRVYDVTTTAGMSDARKDRAELRTLRVGLEAKRKEIKAPALEHCRMIDAEAKRITTEIAALEDPIDEQIKAREAEQERARQERERAEAARLAAIHAELASLTAIPINAMGASAIELQQAIDTLAADTLERFDEVHLPSAQQTKDSALEVLRRMHAERVELDQQRAELERQQCEQAQRDAAAAEERRKADEAAQAERDRLAAEADAKRQQEDAERQARQAQEDAARAAQAEVDRQERDRIASEQADRQRALDAQAAEQRREAEEVELRRQAEAAKEDAERLAAAQAEAQARAEAEAEGARRAGLLYVFTMPDGSRWSVPLMLIATNRAQHYAHEFDGDVERSLAEDTLPLFASSPYDAHDWASNNMNWSDVKAEARIYAPATPLTDDDFQEGWTAGEYSVVNTQEQQA